MSWKFVSLFSSFDSFLVLFSIPYCTNTILDKHFSSEGHTWLTINLWKWRIRLGCLEVVFCVCVHHFIYIFIHKQMYVQMCEVVWGVFCGLTQDVYFHNYMLCVSCHGSSNPRSIRKVNAVHDFLRYHEEYWFLDSIVYKRTYKITLLRNDASAKFFHVPHGLWCKR